ncbi:hypothetical protein JL720_2758 [Aureococcus anophagefferens]|nr:hypothetical protein JL720_2758 [Aureococcus anophagefferens]
MTTYGGIPAVLDETSGGDRATARRYEEVVFEATYADGELRPTRARTYGGDEGRNGPDYLPLAHFVAVHLALAGDRRGDRLHDGLGFVTQHVALTNAFERALRVVAPGVSVPYWDYTEDHVLASMAGGDASALWATDVWSDDVFERVGLAPPRPRGRFAYARVADAAGAARSPYGYLRAPGTADSWYAYAWAAGYLPHGPVHTMVGGYAAPAEAMDELRAILGDDARCHVVCPKPEDYESSGFLDEMKAFMAGYQWYFALDEDRTERFLRFLCETPFSPGDILEAGAPNDVAFWPIHPFVDRLLQYKPRPRRNGEVPRRTHDYKLDYIYDTFDMDHCDALGANATAFPHFPRLAWWGDGAGGA